MTYFKKKLHSQKGASILLALMLFLVCFMVASVILSAATGNADKLRQREDNQKEFLSVSSAAYLLKDVLGNVEYTGWEKREVSLCHVKEVPQTEWCDNVDSKCDEMTFAPGVEARLRKDLEQMVYHAFWTHTQFVTPVTAQGKKLEKDFVVSGEGMEDVKVEMKLDKDTYVLTCSLTLNNSTTKSNEMTVVFKPIKDVPLHGTPKKEISDEKDHHSIEVTVENEDGTTSTETVQKEYDIEVYTIETVVTYDGGTVTKGVSS